MMTHDPKTWIITSDLFGLTDLCHGASTRSSAFTSLPTGSGSASRKRGNKITSVISTSLFYFVLLAK